MRSSIEAAVAHLPGYGWWRAWTFKRRDRRALAGWHRRPVGSPPHAIKQQVLLSYARQYNLRLFVETGTFYGDMVEAMKPHFNRLYSIELSAELHRAAARRFRRDSHVRVIHGDSADQLAVVTAALQEPALFWLDGLYSAGLTANGAKDTPIWQELEHVFGNQALEHVVVIDDARLFGTDPAYPTIRDIEEFVRFRRPDAAIAVHDDMLRITPAAS